MAYRSQFTYTVVWADPNDKDANGNARVKAADKINYTVYQIDSNGGSSQATIYSFRDGATADNPGQTGTSGLIDFWAEPGEYKINISEGTSQNRIATKDIYWNSLQVQPGAISGDYISNDAKVDLAAIAADVLRQAVPIGAVIDWWRPVSSYSVPAGFEICDGRSITSANHDFGTGSTITLPDLRNKFVIGANISAADGTAGAAGAPANDAASAPGIGGSGGSNELRDLTHTHSVPAHNHAHTIAVATGGDHSHTVTESPHSHTASSSLAGGHNHTVTNLGHSHTATTTTDGAHTHTATLSTNVSGVTVQGAYAFPDPATDRKTQYATTGISISGGAHTHGTTAGLTELAGGHGHTVNGATAKTSTNGNHYHPSPTNVNYYGSSATNTGYWANTNNYNNNGMSITIASTGYAGDHNHDVVIDYQADHSHAISSNNSGHSHTITEPNTNTGHFHNITDPGHAHVIIEPTNGTGHTHTPTVTSTNSGHGHTISVGASSGSIVSLAAQADHQHTISLGSASTGVSVNTTNSAHTHAVTGTVGNQAGVSGDAALTSGNALSSHDFRPRYYGLLKIMKVRRA